MQVLQQIDTLKFFVFDAMKTENWMDFFDSILVLRFLGLKDSGIGSK